MRTIRISRARVTPDRLQYGVPVWIFLWFAERPKNSTLIGGAIILAAVVGKALLDARAGKSANRKSDTHELILAR